MAEKEVEKLAEKPDLIPGINNYCDRCCERCPFTSRCLDVAPGSERFGEQENHDLGNEPFGQRLTETFQRTLELLQEAAEDQGIDLDDLDPEGIEEGERLSEELTEDHECCRTARLYGEMVNDWLDSAKDLFGQQVDEAYPHESSLKASGHRDETAADREDTFEVVRWYQHHTYVKLMHAVRGQLEEEPESLKEFPKDSEGSTKVALIAIDRSLAGWGEMRGHFPMYDDDTFRIMVHLEHLRRKVAKAFPGPRAFVRPGFDKIDLNS